MLSLKERLTDILINNHLITSEQLAKALDAQKEKGGRLSAIVVDLKFIKQEDLMLTLSQGLGLPLIDLRRFKIDYQVAKIVPAELSRQYQIVPVSKMGDTITVAMADPLDVFAIDHLATLTGYKINPIIASSQDILQAIDSVYSDATKEMLETLVKEMSGTPFEFIKEEKPILPTDKELYEISQEAPVVRVTNLIIEDAVRRKASDILIEPMENKLRIRLRIDGILQEQKAPPKNMYASIVSRIKVISDLDIAEHRLPQDGRFTNKISGKDVDFRVSVIPSRAGEKVSLRILERSSVTLDIEKLGFSEEALFRLKKAVKISHGMILICGPTGSGKTTTLYSLIKLIDTPDKNIVTVEDPVEYRMEGINQVSAKPEIGLTFASALRSILRQDPNVIMIGEIRDYETVDIAVKSALTGHLVLSTLHTTTAGGSVVRLINMGVEPYLITSSLVCVAAQRLVRKICPYCKQEVSISKEVIASLKLDMGNIENVKFFRGKGCKRCFNTGYAGRAAIAEVVPLSVAIRQLVMQHAQEHTIKQQARQEGMKTLREEGIALVSKGITTLEEVLRVTISDE